MAYSRWSKTSPWYIFWHAGFPDDDPHLACWYARGAQPVLSLIQVLDGVLDHWRTEFPGIPDADRDTLTVHVSRWLAEPEVQGALYDLTTEQLSLVHTLVAQAAALDRDRQRRHP